MTHALRSERPGLELGGSCPPQTQQGRASSKETSRGWPCAGGRGLASQGFQGCQTANNEQRSHRRGKVHIIKSQAGAGDKRWLHKAKRVRTGKRGPVMRGAQESRAWGSEGEGTPQSSSSPHMCDQASGAEGDNAREKSFPGGSAHSWAGCLRGQDPSHHVAGCGEAGQAEATGTLQGLVCVQRRKGDSSSL